MDLYKAIINQDLDLVKKILVESPSAIDDKDDKGVLLPLVAARTGDYEIVRYIVEYSRASMNIRDNDEKTMLHYATQSGNVILCRYLVERVGLSITEADIYLNTPFDIAANENKKEVLSYYENYLGYKYNEAFHNPIRRGMFPDPSIVRVGEDYYMVNSSFIFFPCIPISHSKDLINWEIIGYAITNREWSGLSELEGGRGYWAPDISYDNGTFYITATYRLNDNGTVYRRQIVVSSERPEGPYSKPSYIDEDGIDPSIFHDEDGRHYMLLNRGARIFELSKDCKTQISEASLLYYGDNKRAPEGPHLIKKDGYYYLFIAEGGTGEGHMESVARSKNIMGPYEACPYNPIMRQKNKNATLWRTGHGKPFNTASGEWYMVYLCGRKFIRDAKEGPNLLSPLGRETALDRIRFTEDGWPIVNELKGPSAIAKKPILVTCDIDAKKNESLLWWCPREPVENGVIMEGDKTTIIASRAPLSSKEARNIILRRQTNFDFDFEVMMKLPENLYENEAGVTCYYDENTYVTFCVAKDESGLFVCAKERIGIKDRSHGKIYVNQNRTVKYIKFVVKTRGLDRQFIAYGYDDDFDQPLFTERVYLEDVYYLCDEGIRMGKRFTGAMVGMYGFAKNDEMKVEYTNIRYEDIY